MAKRKIQCNVTEAEISEKLRALADDVEAGRIALAGREAELEGFENFTVSFKRTADGLRMMVKVKHGKEDEKED